MKTKYDDFNAGDMVGFNIGDIVGYHGREGEIIGKTDDSYIVYFCDVNEELDIDADEVYAQNFDFDNMDYQDM